MYNIRLGLPPSVFPEPAAQGHVSKLLLGAGLLLVRFQPGDRPPPRAPRSSPWWRTCRERGGQLLTGQLITRQGLQIIMTADISTRRNCICSVLSCASRSTKLAKYLSGPRTASPLLWSSELGSRSSVTPKVPKTAQAALSELAPSAARHVWDPGVHVLPTGAMVHFLPRM